MTRKEFVLNVVEEMKKNPRAVLAGHGLPAAVLQKIVARDDIMAKLAAVLYSTKNVKKGAKGLKKSDAFRIYGYKNFPSFNAQAREDVETFMAGLNEKDSVVFKNEENILTILLLPEGPKTGEETIEDEIVSGKSVALTFDTAVRKEYKIAGGMYLVIMFGNSIIRPAEEKVAARKEKVNKKTQVRRTPAKVKKELVLKANKKLASLKAKREDLQETAWNLQRQRQQFANIAQQFGGKGNNPISAIGAINKFNNNLPKINEIVDTLDAGDKKLFGMAREAAKKGDKRLVNKLLAALGNEEISKYFAGGMVNSADDKIKARKAALMAEIRTLTRKNEQLLVDLKLAPTPNLKRSVQSMLSKNTSKIKELRARLGTYKDISVKGLQNKAKMLKETHAAIEANLAKGATISQALTSAINALDAKDAEKQIIKQQVIQKVAAGTPMQFAVQSAIQQVINPEPTQAPTLSGKKSISDLMNML
jgi:hypothetical protein